MRSKRDQRIYEKTRKFLEKRKEENIDEKMKLIDQALEKSEGEERYSFLYDLICNYLDEEFRKKNICGFKNNLCKRRCSMMETRISLYFR